MIISDSKQFIFIAIPRTGTNSMESVLRPFGALCWTHLDRVSPEQKHRTVSEACHLLEADKWRQYFKFAFVRNPWDRVVSLYHLLKNPWFLDPKHSGHAHNTSAISFEQYVERHVRWPKLRTQFQMLADDQGGLAMDFVGRFENMADDWKSVCGKIGIEAQPLPLLNKFRHENYRSYYKPATKKMIADRYRVDIEQFGYQFDGRVRAETT